MTSELPCEAPFVHCQVSVLAPARAQRRHRHRRCEVPVLHWLSREVSRDSPNPEPKVLQAAFGARARVVVGGMFPLKVLAIDVP